MHVFYLGAPGAMGGANTEMGHTIAVWRQHGIAVTVIPTWAIDAATRRQVEAIGCKLVAIAGPEHLNQVPGLPGAIVHSMCNSQLWRAYPALRAMRCRVIWSNCMTFMFPEEPAAIRACGPCDAYHFQSAFQKEELERQLIPLGYNHGMGHLIPGAFDFTAIPHHPCAHTPDSTFTIGRLARPDADKWSSNHWPILARVPYAHRRGLAMGWGPHLDRKCGATPAWAETLAPQKIPVTDFLGRCHAMVGLNGGARENWPRIGLEAMAAGVPLVCQNAWGWKEMIEDVRTGFLTNSDEEMAFRLAQLAYDEDLRQAIIAAGRSHVQNLANPERIGRQWRELFASLGA